ncbi:hypothetical protein [Maribellus maritimus]|uniref:hypothetical protein n=1 Tax=Maribellus maritimus TaxID=2870838 RepID=UPI001EEBBED0|nr:hypothetical protein [Maribellus maritimus]MCG6188187.1 hypothetical protein [Maribellus maritimus]
MFLLAACNSVTCDNGAEPDVLEIFYTEYKDLQTISIEGYKKGSNFTELTDASCKIIAYSEIDTIMHTFDCRLNKKINTKPYSKITLQADHRVCGLLPYGYKCRRRIML